MNTSRLFSLQPRPHPHLQSWDRYREMELTANKQNAVTESGDLLEYETLVCRLLPPNIRIDNELYEDKTVLIIDSANRPGTLVEVVQCLTELGLSVKQARISSDGGWFVDEFHVAETPSGRVTDPKKLSAIKSVLSCDTGEAVEVHTVFQIAGPEAPGLLAEVTELLTHNGLEIRTAAAWTYHGRFALVVGVTERNTPVADTVKLHRLKQLLTRLVQQTGDAAVSVEQVEGPVHHERRLHQLLLADEIQAWKQLTRLQRQHSLPFPGPINTSISAAGAAADADADMDQPHTPRTPQQQWQRKMLPPQWTVDQRGKPVYRDTALEQAIQQQLQQQQQQDAAAARQDKPSGSGRAGGEPAGNASLTASSSSTLPRLPAGGGGGGAAVAGSNGASTKDNAAAAAAQQASVDKLIALLQPQKLAHMSSLPPMRHQSATAAAAAAAAAEDDMKDTDNVADQGAAASRESSNGSSSAEPAEQKQELHKASLRLVAEPAPGLVGGASPAAAASGTAAGGGSSGTQPTVPHGAGLPPRAPSVSSQNISATAAQVQQQLQQFGSSASAPTSPIAGIPHFKVGTLSTAAGGTGAGINANVLFSPGRFASASAAAGQLSPRGLSSASSAPLGSAVGSGLGGVSGFKQQLGGMLNGGLDAQDLGVTVQIQHSSLFNYWLVEIRCRDRNKLFFDTVCTLCDMRYDIFHATIDGEPSGWANQLFYIRPRFGECVWDERRASVLKAMLTSAVQRRFPPGLRVHVFSGSTVCLQDLVNAMKRHKLTITRCKVRAYDNTSHTFSLLNQDGSLPSRQYVQMACQSAGGELVEAPLDVCNPCVATVLRSLDARGRFAFSFLNMRAYRGMAAAAGGSAAGGGPVTSRLLFPAGEAGAAGVWDQAGVLTGGEHGVHGGLAGRRAALAVGWPGSSGGAGQRDAAGSGGGSYNSSDQPSF